MGGLKNSDQHYSYMTWTSVFLYPFERPIPLIVLAYIVKVCKYYTYLKHNNIIS